MKWTPARFEDSDEEEPRRSTGGLAEWIQQLVISNSDRVEQLATETVPRVDTTNPRAFVSEWADWIQHMNRGTQFMPGDLIEFTLGEAFGKQISHWGVYVGMRNGQHALMQFWEENPKKLPHRWYKSLPLVEWYRVLKNGKIGGWYMWHFSVSKDPKIENRVKFECEHFRINNALDDSHEPFSAAEIVDRAEADYGTTGYNLFTNNCEHYANRCRYGVSRSVQIEKMPRPIRPSATATSSKEK